MGVFLGSNPVDILGGQPVSMTANLQEKNASAATTAQRILPDAGYDGMSRINIAAATLQNKNVTPTESSQQITADTGNYGLGTVTVGAISSTYIGSDITQRDETDLSASGATVTVPAGYYAEQETKNVRSGSVSNPTASKGTVSNHAIAVTPSVTSSSGYITGGTKSGTAVTVSASELVSGTLEVTSNGTKDVTNYASVSVAVPTGSTINNQNKSVTPTESQQTVTADSGYSGLGTVTVGAISSTYVGSGIAQRDETDLTRSGATVTVPAGYYAEQETKTIGSGSATPASSISGTSATISTNATSGTITLTKTVSNTPQVSAGYISTGTAGNSSVSLTASATINPTPTASGKTVTTPRGYYTAAKTTDVSTMTLPTAATSSHTGTSKATISRSTSAQYLNIPTGYNETASYYTISATPNGTVTAPSSISGTSATVSTGTNTLTLTKTVSVTPNVTTRGYISAGTAGNSSVSLTASVTTKAAATITPGTTNQTIASGTYLTGTQTIAGDADLVASNILSTANIFGVQGSVVVQNYYTGSSAPSSSLGQNGDIYIQA